MQRRTDKSDILSMPMWPLVLLSWALIIGGAAMMAFSGVPVTIIATSLLLLSLVWWQKPD